MLVRLILIEDSVNNQPPNQIDMSLEV